MNQYFRQKIRENAPNIIMFGGVSIVLLSLIACVLNGQRKARKPTAEPVPKISSVEPNAVQQPHDHHGSLSVQEFEYDGTSYLLVEKNSAIAVTKK